jgi:hypothetical protein
MCRPGEAPLELLDRALSLLPAWAAQQPDEDQGQLIVHYRKAIDRIEAASAEATRRFEKSGAYKTDGALGIIPWLQTNTRLAGNHAAERAKVARQLEELPRTEEALARGEIGYGHALAMAVSVEHVGSKAVREAESALLKSAETMDAGRFMNVIKDFEHRADANAALREANWAHARRYVAISGPFQGLAKIEGQLVPEAAATLRHALEPFLKPSKNDDRSGGQRMHDALIELCRRAAGGRTDGAGPRPQIIVKASVDTLAGLPKAPAGEIEDGGMVPAETVRRLACDAAITRITGLGELAMEITHASRSVPSPIRRAVVARDGHCVFPGCDRPPSWCQIHHLKFWAEGGETKLENLALICGAHHRKVHEEGWRLERREDQWIATPLPRMVIPRARTD